MVQVSSDFVKCANEFTNFWYFFQTFFNHQIQKLAKATNPKIVS